MIRQGVEHLVPSEIRCGRPEHDGVRRAGLERPAREERHGARVRAPLEGTVYAARNGKGSLDGLSIH